MKPKAENKGAFPGEGPVAGAQPREQTLFGHETPLKCTYWVQILLVLLHKLIMHCICKGAWPLVPPKSAYASDDFGFWLFMKKIGTLFTQVQEKRSRHFRFCLRPFVFELRTRTRQTNRPANRQTDGRLVMRANGINSYQDTKLLFIFCQSIDRLSKFFHCYTLPIKRSLKISSHLNSISTLPCEIIAFSSLLRVVIVVTKRRTWGLLIVSKTPYAYAAILTHFVPLPS